MGQNQELHLAKAEELFPPQQHSHSAMPALSRSDRSDCKSQRVRAAAATRFTQKSKLASAKRKGILYKHSSTAAEHGTASRRRRSPCAGPRKAWSGKVETLGVVHPDDVTGGVPVEGGGVGPHVAAFRLAVLPFPGVPVMPQP